MHRPNLLFSNRIQFILGIFFLSIKFLIPLLLCITFLRVFLITSFVVSGSSMEPTLRDASYLLVNRLAYRIHQPQRGDIIIFQDPLKTGQFDVKRIVGVPGDTINIHQNSIVVTSQNTTKAIVLEEAYLPKNTITQQQGYVFPLQLQATQYLVFGDNRLHSIDSRTFGPIDRSAIVGRVQWLFD